MLIPVLVALLARLHHLDFESLFMDEILQTSFYAQDFGQIANAAAVQRQPPLDYWIGALIFRIDPSDFALRLPAAIFGVGTVLLIMLLTQRALSRMTPMPSQLGVAAIVFTVGLLAATLPYAVYVSQDLRPYSSAICLLLLQLLIIDSVLQKQSVSLGMYAALTFTTLALLLSRTLSPLVICAINSLILFVMWAINLKREGWFGTEKQKRLVYIQISFVAALPFYLPFLIHILQQKRRYLRAEPGSVDHWPLSGISDAWQAQLEPLGSPHLLVLIIAILFVVSRYRKAGSLSLFTLLLLLGATCLHFIVFTLMTAYPFRPPYSVYVYPLVLILGGVGAGVVITYMDNHLKKPLQTIGLACLVLVAIVPTLLSFTNFKNQRIKSDWRSLSYYINNVADGNDLLIAETLSNSRAWEPGFYGSLRYAVTEKRQQIDLRDLTENPSLLKDLSLKPRLVLFHYRGYYLTQASTVPIMPTPSRTAPIDINELNFHPEFDVVRFNSFFILSMKQDHHDTRAELHALIDLLLEVNQPGPYLNDLNAAAASLSDDPDHKRLHQNSMHDLQR